MRDAAACTELADIVAGAKPGGSRRIRRSSSNSTGTALQDVAAAAAAYERAVARGVGVAVSL